MPHRKIDRLDMKIDPWIDDLPDRCLRDIVLEAIVSRHAALKEGALQHKSCKRALESADATLEQLANGTLAGATACKRAADALRKYTQALECVRPTAAM